ncbi:two-component sensor histidine kinase, partial [Actinomadura sp. DSM 109109]|nr:two-component sensor histidine kinase [Actinomadura lepetitiana]
MALLTAAAVALAVAACASAGWLLTRNQLYRELDRRLGAVSGRPPGAPGDRGGPPPFPNPPPLIHISQP